MDVIPVDGVVGERAYVVPCAGTDAALLVGVAGSNAQRIRQALDHHGLRAAVELSCEEDDGLPLVARLRLSPRTLGRRVVVDSPGSVVRLAPVDGERTLDPEVPLDTFVCHVGPLEVRALPCTVDPAEVVWRVGPAVFTARILFGPGAWPAAATPRPALGLPGDLAVYPRHVGKGHPVSTITLERTWYHRWRKRGYDPSIPDPTATIPSGRARTVDGSVG